MHVHQYLRRSHATALHVSAPKIVLCVVACCSGVCAFCAPIGISGNKPGAKAGCQNIKQTLQPTIALHARAAGVAACTEQQRRPGARRADPVAHCHRSATFLPEVAAHEGWSRQQTVDALVRKAGFAGAATPALRAALRLVRYRSSARSLSHGAWRSLSAAAAARRAAPGFPLPRLVHRARRLRRAAHHPVLLGSLRAWLWQQPALQPRAPCQLPRPTPGRRCGAGPRALRRARPRWRHAWRRRARPPPPLQTAASPPRAAPTWTKRRRRSRAGGQSPCQHRLLAHRALACQHRLLAIGPQLAVPSRERSRSALRPSAYYSTSEARRTRRRRWAQAPPMIGRLRAGLRCWVSSRPRALGAARWPLHPCRSPLALGRTCSGRCGCIRPCSGSGPQDKAGMVPGGQGRSACLLSIVHCTGSAQGGWALHSIALRGSSCKLQLLRLSSLAYPALYTAQSIGWVHGLFFWECCNVLPGAAVAFATDPLRAH